MNPVDYTNVRIGVNFFFSTLVEHHAAFMTVAEYKGLCMSMQECLRAIDQKESQDATRVSGPLKLVVNRSVS